MKECRKRQRRPDLGDVARTYRRTIRQTLLVQSNCLTAEFVFQLELIGENYVTHYLSNQTVLRPTLFGSNILARSASHIFCPIKRFCCGRWPEDMGENYVTHYLSNEIVLQQTLFSSKVVERTTSRIICSIKSFFRYQKPKNFGITSSHLFCRIKLFFNERQQITIIGAFFFCECFFFG